jgi:hypothetical protein
MRIFERRYFWLVLKLEISYRVMISWRILVSCFVNFIFLHVEIFEFPLFFFCLQILFNEIGQATVWHTPCTLFVTKVKAPFHPLNWGQSPRSRVEGTDLPLYKEPPSFCRSTFCKNCYCEWMCNRLIKLYSVLNHWEVPGKIKLRWIFAIFWPEISYFNLYKGFLMKKNGLLNLLDFFMEEKEKSPNFYYRLQKIAKIMKKDA